MRSLFLFLVVVTDPALLLAEEPKAQTYPDLSSPVAAAFSLGVALAQGDEATARSIYVGQDKEFSTLLDGFVKSKRSSDKLMNAVYARFGKGPATELFRDDGRPTLGGKMSAPTFLASGKAEEKGNTAEVDCWLALTLQLEKSDGKWKIHKLTWSELVPAYNKMVTATMEATVRVNEQVLREVEEGKYRHLFEVYAARQRVALAEVERLQRRLQKESRGKE